MADPQVCPGCNLALPASAPRGLCPACLLRRALVLDDESPDLDRIGSSPPDPPSPTRARDPEPSSTVPVDEGSGPSVEDTADPTELGFAARPPDFPESIGRYRLERLIGWGGMGLVIRGRDVEIGREIALKVLRPEYLDDPEFVAYLVEEAQICGQLVHPAIVPVYEMGTFPDGRPFFVMKLVEGRTFDDLLRSRSRPAEDLPRHLAIFDQVCQAMAYAHSRGVIHRDLKPRNVMVGEFGEVQTMDWGLAKRLARREDANADRPIRTARKDPIATDAGIIKGSCKYMPPEQARGEIDLLDERADVFALGSILCEILAGRAAYAGRSYREIVQKAIEADLAEALAELDACGADAELLQLARACLVPARDDRPRDAGEVAAAMASHVAGVPERPRLAELDRVAAEGIPSRGLAGLLEIWRRK